jgi:putative Mg2+ transporter-C (MgtC) family protein
LSSAVIAKVLLAVLLSGIIGFEREMHGRSAGLRTHILVCLGATLVMIVGRHITLGASHDPGRVAAGVITGIGFLGAGEIIRTQSGVHGLTTAACLWLVAALGVAVGSELYGLSVLCTGLAVTVLFALSRLERRLPELQTRQVTVTLLGTPAEAAGITDMISSFGCRIADKSFNYDRENGQTEAEFRVKVREKDDPALLVEKIASSERVSRVSWR